MWADILEVDSDKRESLGSGAASAAGWMGCVRNLQSGAWDVMDPSCGVALRLSLSVEFGSDVCKILLKFCFDRNSESQMVVSKA